MTKDESNDRPKKPTHHEGLKTDDLIQYLKHIAKMHKDLSTGNAELGDSLLLVANSLKTFSNIPLNELKNFISVDTDSKGDVRKTKKSKKQLPLNIDKLDATAIEEILKDQDFTKMQIIEVGTRRFGISRSKLVRLNRDAVSESVLAALNHEKSLKVISQEARRGGIQRNS